MADEQPVEVEPTEPTEPETQDYIEYLGERGEGQYGTDFLTSHTLPKGDGVWKRLRVTPPSKDLVWERDPFGPGHGQKGNRFLVPVEDLTPEIAAGLEKVPGFRKVNV